MFNPARIRSDFNNAAARYDAHASLQNSVMRKLLGVMGGISPHAIILDAGCGTGALARYLQFPPPVGGRENIVPYTIVALDNAHAMCLQAHHSGNLPVTADMAQLPFASDSFDIVFSSLALQWALDWKATVTEWLRVLKPGGTLVFSTFGEGTLNELSQSFRSIDNHAHVSPFIAPHDIQNHFSATVEQETVTEYYTDVTSIARRLKALGARNKLPGRAGLTTPGQLRRLEEHYAENYGTEKGLPVSWNIIYAKMQKP